ncbi:hypothetical protein M2451_000101 [Dysgonomonas sp. PFB1-18]|uniref:hypothetical protein n=1 Tax=unclassified Dysgonomonas TaxID=2630389 RepID=UPI002473FBBE|nr:MULTISPECIES: hypothetical protein [unclassified Dysgonomonas]MDH6307652.1 hypothetical protein [Dysgonomonas sp. PF1-14]MDH6337570.1 hypothetical protein [Dysgonomonas sp. PF1-16]MDH6378794.1 hypothetical protein [Dysgonomonas sp. PFB1-18]MDH6399212.1 hypothetical protein [Dysgonomonas sp. PF1-23]
MNSKPICISMDTNALQHIVWVSGIVITALLILICPAIWWKISKKKDAPFRPNMINVFFQTLISIPFILIIGLIITLVVDSYLIEDSSKEFSSENWHKYAEKRTEYANQIVDNQLLIGKTKEEVVAILGNDTVNYFSFGIRYDLGNQSAIDRYWLLIHFEDGKVYEVIKAGM